MALLYLISSSVIGYGGNIGEVAGPGAFQAAFSSGESPLGSNGTVLVNEIYPDPDTDLNDDGVIDQVDEFIELYNPTSSPISIAGWSVSDNSGTHVLNDLSIGSRCFLVLWRIDTGLKLGRDDNVELRNSSGAVSDHVEYLSFGKGDVLGRSPDGAERFRRTSYPTPGWRNRPPPVIVINEILVDPVGKNTGNQWVELLNLGGCEDLEGFTLDNGRGINIPLAGELSDGERILISLGGPEILPPHPTEIRIINAPQSNALYISGDDIQLTDPDGYLVDYLAWGNSSNVNGPRGKGVAGAWDGSYRDEVTGSMVSGLENPTIPEGSSIQRYPDGHDNGSATNWARTTYGTGNTCGWNNSLDPTISIVTAYGSLNFNRSEEREFQITIQNVGNICGRVNFDVLTAVEGWRAVDWEGLELNLSEGEEVELNVQIQAPGRLFDPNHCPIDLQAYWTDMPFLMTRVKVTAILPGPDPSIAAGSLELNGDEASTVPEGVVLGIECLVLGGGEIGCEEIELELSLENRDQNRIIEVRTYDGILTTSSRSFRSRVDTLDLSGNYTVTLRLDPEDLIQEISERNNTLSWNISVIPTPVGHSESHLLFTEVLWNCSASQMFAVFENPTDDAIDIGGMRISDGERWGSFKDGSSIQAHRSIGIAWGGEAISRIDGEMEIYRFNEGGYSGYRMELDGPAPRPDETGKLVLQTRYRKEIDTLLLKRDAGKTGNCSWMNAGIETTYGTVMSRFRGTDGLPVDTNTSLDWTVHRGGCSLVGFLPSPPSGGSGEFSLLSARQGGGDISGYVLSCGRTLASIPNGTHVSGSGTFSLAKDPESFNKWQGVPPDLSTGYSSETNGLEIFSARVEGYQELTLPDAGGVLLLIDPGNRVVSSITWGDGTEIGEVPRDTIIGPIEGDRIGSVGLGTTPLPSLLDNRADPDVALVFSDLIEGVKWILECEDVLIITPSIDRPDIHAGLIDHLEAAGGLEIFLGIPPWEDPGPLVEQGTLKLRRSIAVSLEDEGANMRYYSGGAELERSGTLMISDNRIVISAMPMSSVGGFTKAAHLTIGLEDQSLCAELMERYWPESGDRWIDASPILDQFTDTMPILENSDGAVVSGSGLNIHDLTANYCDPIRPDRGMEGEISLIHQVGDLDMLSILDLLKRGTSVRLMLDTSTLHPIPSDTAREDHRYIFSDLDKELLLRARMLLDEAPSTGGEIHIRMISPEYGRIMGANLYLSHGACQFTLGPIGDTTWPSLFLEGDDIEPLHALFDELWSSSYEVPWGMMGYDIEDREESDLRIQEIYFDTYLADDPDEYVAVRNYGGEVVNLRGYTLSDDEGEGYFRDGTVMIFEEIYVQPGGLVFIARDGGRFKDQNGFDADISWFNGSIPTGGLLLEGDMTLSNGNDTVCLRDRSGVIVDVVPYGYAVWKEDVWPHDEGGGWSGDPAPDLGRGKVLVRQDRDTNTREDWLSYRPRYPAQSRWGYFPEREISEMTCGICPDSGSDVLKSTIEGAGSSLRVNVYEINSEWVVSSLIGAADRGVDVKILLEGAPVGGISSGEKRCVKRMLDAGIDVRFMISDMDREIRDSYRFDHAKYIASDRDVALISSDNFKDSSFPPPGENVLSTTRGWVISMRSQEINGDLTRVFDHDLAGPDVVKADEFIDLEGAFYNYIAPPSDRESSGSRFGELFVDEGGTGSISLSPDNIGRSSNVLLDMIRTADEEVLVELLDISTSWGLNHMPENGLPARMDELPLQGGGHINPYIEALLKAAERGVKVKVLLDGTDFDGDGEPENQDVADEIATCAELMGLSGLFEVRVHPAVRFDMGREIANIHNKGVVVDSEKVWISSFNWGPTSGLENREVGIGISSSEAAGYYRSAFLHDWGGTLQDEIALLGKEVRSVRDGDGILASVTLQVQWKGRGALGLYMVPLEEIDNLSLKEHGTSIEEGDQGVVTLSSHGESGEFALIAFQGDRSICLQKITAYPMEGPSEGWDLPWYGSPYTPILILLSSALLISAIRSAAATRFRDIWRKRSNRVSEE
ncbi:MAG: lamin tail domain-containing protein [Thermoplasmata archaeon]|nr:lamin tail domain-containing protein [Thermoplasmata archaeon]